VDGQENNKPMNGFPVAQCDEIISEVVFYYVASDFLQNNLPGHAAMVVRICMVNCKVDQNYLCKYNGAELFIMLHSHL
jgi:hypothetical protein